MPAIRSVVRATTPGVLLMYLDDDSVVSVPDDMRNSERRLIEQWLTPHWVGADGQAVDPALVSVTGSDATQVGRRMVVHREEVPDGYDNLEVEENYVEQEEVNGAVADVTKTRTVTRQVPRVKIVETLVPDPSETGGLTLIDGGVIQDADPAEAWARAKSQRGALLSTSDWTQQGLADSDLSKAQIAAWAARRKRLKNITKDFSTPEEAIAWMNTLTDDVSQDS